MGTKLRVGVAGVGSLGQWHARVYSELPDVTLAGVYDADPRRAAEIAERYRTRAFPSLVELADSVEAASIVVPTDRHHEVSTLFLERGVHLLVEKPIAASSAEAVAMTDMARTRSLVLQIGHVERFSPALDPVRGLLKAPRLIEASRLAPYPPSREGLPPRGTEVSVVLDLMIHDLDIILNLVHAPVTAICASGFKLLSSSEDFATTWLTFDGGVTATITASRINQERVRKMNIYQDDAIVTVDYQNQAARIARRGAGGLETTDLVTAKDEPLKRELTAFTECVRRRDKPVVDGLEATAALKLAESIIDVIRGSDPCQSLPH